MGLAVFLLGSPALTAAACEPGFYHTRMYRGMLTLGRETSVNNIHYKPGTPLKICCFAYTHYAIVSDLVVDKKPELISLSFRTGTVAEEPWDVVVRGPSFRSKTSATIQSRSTLRTGSRKT